MKTLTHTNGMTLEQGSVSRKQVNGSDFIKSTVWVFLMAAFMFYPGCMVAKTYGKIYSNESSGSDSSKKAEESVLVKRSFAAKHNKVVYSVQIISLAGILPPNAKFFKKCGHANEHIINKQYVYTIGEYKTVAEAQRMSDELRKKGYSDALTVGFVNGNRIMVDGSNTGLCNK